MKKLNLFFVTLFLAISFGVPASESKLTLKQAFAMKDEDFLKYYNQLNRSTIEKFSVSETTNAPFEIEELNLKVKDLLLNHELSLPLVENILSLQNKTISFKEFQEIFSEIIATDTLFVITHLKNIKNQNYADLVSHKNILTLDFTYKKAVSDLKENNIIEVLAFRKKMFDAITSSKLLSNDQLNVQQAFENIPKITTNPQVKNSQVLVVYFNNEGFSFKDDLYYAMAKDWMKKHFSHMYKKIFFFIGDGEQPKDSLWEPNMLSEIPKSILDNIQEDDNAKKIFENTLLKLEEAKEIKNVDMFWLAHDGHAPFRNFVNPIKTKKISKLRYLNNSWCDGAQHINDFFPEMKQFRYTTGSIGKNNPFPYQFFLMDLLGKGLPLALSEATAKIMHLNFYNSFLNILAPSKTEYVALKYLLKLYSSWFESYGSNNFSLLEDYKNKDFNFPEFMKLDHNEFEKETFATDSSYVQKTPVQLSQLETILANVALSITRGALLPKLDKKKDKTPEILLSNSQIQAILDFTVTSLNGTSFANFFKQVFRSLALTLSYFLETEKQSTIIDNSFEYNFSEELLQNLKFIILNMYKVANTKDDISTIIADLFTNLEKLRIKYFEKSNKLTINWFTSKSLSINAESIPALKPIAAKLPFKIYQIKLAKNFEIKISFDSTDKMILKLAGLSIYTNILGIVEIPEIIIDLKKGTINYLKNFPVYPIE